MRKLVTSGLAAVVCATAAGVALGATEATTFSVKYSTRTEAASTGFKFNIGFADPEALNGVPSGLKNFKIKFHRGTVLDGRGAPRCRVTNEELDAEGVEACPEASRIGSGTAEATDAAGATVESEAVIFNEVVDGREAFLFLFLVNDAVVAGFDAFIKGRTISAKGLTGALPGDLVVTEFTGTIRKHSKGRGKRRRNLITSPAVCPPGSRRWTNTGTFVFQSGEQDTASNTSRCRPGN